ncbi:hypothetical protein [Janthinobacterium sp.]|uniref:hypothetical protein n=1 Tax=Janthinobacterium sp. TaxID=1871054 RepID=UPI00293D2352|nr:hypothetical protein [Janthinobacterium sp.]
MDKVVDKAPLTGRNASVAAALNKMPNPKAIFYPNQINDLQTRPGVIANLGMYFEKIFCADRRRLRAGARNTLTKLTHWHSVLVRRKHILPGGAIMGRDFPILNGYTWVRKL